MAYKVAINTLVLKYIVSTQVDLNLFILRGPGQ